MEFGPDIEHCLEVVRKGGLILYPTDTIWGIGCDACNPEAVDSIYALKQRSETKSMIILLAAEKDLLHYVAHPDPRVFDYLSSLQKPTTIIYSGAIGMADNLIGQDGTIGIRITKDTFCKQLIKRLRKPLVSTSANLSGEKSPAYFNEISPGIKKGVDYIVQYRQNDTSSRQPSSIVKWNNDGNISVIRP